MTFVMSPLNACVQDSTYNVTFAVDTRYLTSHISPSSSVTVKTTGKTPEKSIKAVIHLTENNEIMFIVTYFYNVLKNKVGQFLDIKRRAKKVYFRHGCMDYEIFRSDNDRCLEIN